jgi:hypothetical protein
MVRIADIRSGFGIKKILHIKFCFCTTFFLLLLYLMFLHWCCFVDPHKDILYNCLWFVFYLSLHFISFLFYFFFHWGIVLRIFDDDFSYHSLCFVFYPWLYTFSEISLKLRWKTNKQIIQHHMHSKTDPVFELMCERQQITRHETHI